MARKTGTLMLQHVGEGNTVEQGTIVLQNGQIIDASLGFMRGKNAYATLATWSVCHFAFQASSSTITPRAMHTPYPGSLRQMPTLRRGGSLPFNGLVDSREAFNELSPTPEVPGSPYRLREAQEVLGYFDRLGLTRAHRQLFLLINGRYSISELMRLSSHHDNDFERLLADLERVGLIHR